MIHIKTLQWRHSERDGVSNHQHPNCLLNRLFRRKSKKHQSFASLAYVRGIHRWPMNSPHKGPVTRKMVSFDDVIMKTRICISSCCTVQWLLTFVRFQDTLLLTLIDFSASMDKWLYPLQRVGWNYLSIPKLQRCNRWSLGLDNWLHATLYWTCDYVFMMGLNLNSVSKKGPHEGLEL